MHQILYTSRAAARFDDAALRTLCLAAAERNRAAGITGLLLFDGLRFMQALEGPEPAVRRMMQAIAADARHRDIVVIADQPIARQHFGGWAMDYLAAPAESCSEAFLSRVKRDLVEIDDPMLMAAFMGFAMLGAAREAPSGAGS